MEASWVICLAISCFSIEFVLQLQVVLDNFLRRPRILFVNRVEEDAGQRIIIGLRNGIVLVIVAARARHRQAKESAGHHIHAIVTLIGARHFVRAVVVIPGPEPQEASRGQRFVAGLGVHQIARQLRFDKLIVRHVVVERLNHPIAIRVRVGIRPVASGIGVQTAIVVLAVARHIQPHSSPALAIVRRREQPVDHLRERVRELCPFQRPRFLRASAADRSDRAWRGESDPALAAGPTGFSPSFSKRASTKRSMSFFAHFASLTAGTGVVLKRLEGPKGAALGRDGVLSGTTGDGLCRTLRPYRARLAPRLRAPRFPGRSACRPAASSSLDRFA